MQYGGDVGLRVIDRNEVSAVGLGDGRSGQLARRSRDDAGTHDPVACSGEDDDRSLDCAQLFLESVGVSDQAPLLGGEAAPHVAPGDASHDFIAEDAPAQWRNA